MITVAQTLADKLDEIRHRRIDLTEIVDSPEDNNPHRPEIQIWAGADDGDPAHITLCVKPLWGQNIRHVDLGPIEARLLAKHLTEMADAIAKAEAR